MKCLWQAASLNVTLKTTEQHLIARSDKCVAYITNNTVGPADPMGAHPAPPPLIFGREENF